MAKESTILPVYRPKLVEDALLGVAVNLHPARLTIHELSLKVATDPHDGEEIETITEAIRELRRCGLFRYRNDDEVVEPTQAALHAFDLLAR
jgi:hypothetical protein